MAAFNFSFCLDYLPRVCTASLLVKWETELLASLNSPWGDHRCSSPSGVVETSEVVHVVVQMIREIQARAGVAGQGALKRVHPKRGACGAPMPWKAMSTVSGSLGNVQGKARFP